jgi:heme/copper-type cytochrome/quinol oxidase subunit 2
MTGFAVAIFILVVIALIATILIGMNPEEKKKRNILERSRNLLIIYLVITVILVIALINYITSL